MGLTPCISLCPLFEVKVGLTWVDPIPEPESIVIWTTSEVEYDTQDDESGDCEYLESTL